MTLNCFATLCLATYIHTLTNTSMTLQTVIEMLKASENGNDLLNALEMLDNTQND